MTPQRRAELLRFLVAGTINTLWGWSIYALAIVLGAQAWLALAIGMVAGIAFNFVSLGAFVFRNLVLSRLPRFILAYGFLYTTNLVCLTVMRGWVDDPIWSQLILTPPMAVLSYVVLSKLVFART
ncbi:GtrA family protein [Pseudorhodoferax sp.]|uniref:GtrA family protein n=1 Tax=Pseudorhodoferax sp. TaxID=1993553 RepID=UPI002DD66BDD|nr:GtrA family protein [Pseudorhodoferax sp.]